VQSRIDIISRREPQSRRGSYDAVYLYPEKRAQRSADSFMSLSWLSQCTLYKSADDTTSAQLPLRLCGSLRDINT